ncbi:153_t:CDS:1, partial [Acaulospora colombiana]
MSRVSYPTFPQWTEFPRLEELVLDRAFKPQFHPLPRKHPLRKIVTQSWSIADIESWMDSDNLREIGLLYSCPASNLADEGDSMTEQEIDKLFEKADMRG